MEERKCPVCEKPIKGRTDKKFCDPSCKSAWHYQVQQEEGRGLYARIHGQLKTNRRILRKYNRAGMTTIRAQVLIDQGFRPRFHTHRWTNSQKEIYRFVYEFGFLGKTVNGTKKFTLVTWQAYMEK